MTFKQLQSTIKNILQTKEQQHERKEGTKTVSLSTYSMVYVTYRVMQNTNVVVLLYLAGHLATFNSSSLYALYTKSKKVEIKHCLHFAFCHIIKTQISNIKVSCQTFRCDVCLIQILILSIVSLVLHVQYAQQRLFIILLKLQMNNNL